VEEFFRELASTNRDDIFKIACTEGQVSRQLGLDGIALPASLLRSNGSGAKVRLNYALESGQDSKRTYAGRSVAVSGVVDDGKQRIHAVVSVKARATGRVTSEWCVDALSYDLVPAPG
jgi:hypothetical protein